MDKYLIPPFKKQLLEQRQGLLQQIAQQRGGTVGRAEVAAGHFENPQDSHAQVITERELEFALGEREIAELAQIDAALRRIEDGKYGMCVGCGTDIPAQRLHAAPEAACCIACQSKLEQGITQPAGISSHSSVPHSRRLP
jgi:DnaK suppressor protein